MGGFELTVLLRQSAAPTDVLHVYIEGDGAPWPNPYQPPHDPTPTRALAWQLAQSDPAPAVAYLGRPCQYLGAAALGQCRMAYWTERRFAPEVIHAYDELLDQLKETQGVRALRLIGYSGGGVLAALLAQRRTDIDAWLTVAAPLAVSVWLEGHRATPLTGSLDPLLGPPARAPGLHLVGQVDEVVPVAVLARFVARHGGRLQTVAGFDHVCCWADNWPALLQGALRPTHAP